MEEIDFTIYIRPPRIGATSGLVLTVRLIRAAPPVIAPHVQAALLRVHEAGSLLQDAVRGRQRRSFSARPADQRFDGAWGGLHMRVVACTRLIGDPDAARAAALLANLFPRGLSFLMFDYEAEWVHSRELLTRIKLEGHTEALTELAGQRFVTAVHDAHKGLGEALGLEGEQKVEASLMVGAQVLALSNAIATYARLFAGTVVDAPSLAAFRAAMAPLDAHREAHRRSGGSGAAEGEGEIEGETEGEGIEGEGVEGIDIDEPLPPVPAI